MKSIYIVLSFILLTLDSSAIDRWQFSIDYNKKLNSKFISSSKNYDFWAINIDFYLSKSISLNYVFGYAYSNERAYFRIPAGPVGGFNLFELMYLDQSTDDQDDDDDVNDAFSLPAALLFFLPEGISYNVDLSEYLSVAFTLSPFQYYIFSDKNGMGSSIGIKFNYNVENIIISPHIDLDAMWFDPTPNIGLGLSVGLRY